uniref:Intraflagellar transport protein 46 homolog n=1 Tax=Setaria digitata TaxID=48799 RepID=A0A915PT95_9BILA
MSNDENKFLSGHPVEFLTDSAPVTSNDFNNSEEQLLFSNENKSLSNLSTNKSHSKSALAAMVQGVANLATATTIGTGKVNDNITTHSNDGMEPFTPLSSEEKELLSYIEAYTAKLIRIEPFLKPFLPDYIPAVGDVDAFIKIPRPDEADDDLGLAVLDEPAMEQSDPIILNIKMRNELKDKTDKIQIDVPVKKLERADENIEEIERWISSIKEIHRTKPSDTVVYLKPMPNIEHLMQEWPTEMENLLKLEQLPTASLDVSLEEYVDICLALLDIPVQKSRIQSLHVLFTLFAEFRNSQHFRNLAKNNLVSSSSNNNVFNGRTNVNEPERLEL